MKDCTCAGRFRYVLRNGKWYEYYNLPFTKGGDMENDPGDQWGVHKDFAQQQEIDDDDLLKLPEGSKVWSGSWFYPIYSGSSNLNVSVRSISKFISEKIADYNNLFEKRCI